MRDYFWWHFWHILSKVILFSFQVEFSFVPPVTSSKSLILQQTYLPLLTFVYLCNGSPPSNNVLSFVEWNILFPGKSAFFFFFFSLASCKLHLHLSLLFLRLIFSYFVVTDALIANFGGINEVECEMKLTVTPTEYQKYPLDIGKFWFYTKLRFHLERLQYISRGISAFQNWACYCQFGIYQIPWGSNFVQNTLWVLQVY